MGVLWPRIHATGAGCRRALRRNSPIRRVEQAAATPQNSAVSARQTGTDSNVPGRIRTCDRRIRNPLTNEAQDQESAGLSDEQPDAPGALLGVSGADCTDTAPADPDPAAAEAAWLDASPVALPPAERAVFAGILAILRKARESTAPSGIGGH